MSYSRRDVLKIAAAAGTGAALALNRDLLSATESLFQQGQDMKAIQSAGECIPCAMTLIVALQSLILSRSSETPTVARS